MPDNITSNLHIPNPSPHDAPNPLAKSRKKKKIVLGIILLLIIGSIVLGFFLFSSNKNGISQIINQKINQTQSNAKAGNLYFANLEYNLASKSATLTNSGTINGELPKYYPTLPNVKSTDFAYKVEVISEKNELLLNGWDYFPKSITQTENNTLLLEIITQNQTNASIIVSIPSKEIIWSGKIP